MIPVVNDFESRYPLLETGRALSDLHPRVLARAQGCLLGQLAGDSLGSLVEFMSEDDIQIKYPDGPAMLAAGGAFDTLAGQPTDDSELALMLARSIIRTGRYDQGEAAVAYAHWYGSRPFDCGTTTARALAPALTALQAGAAAEAVAAAARESASADSQANGALMRVSPLGILAHGMPADGCAALARQDAMLTHPHPVCQEANAVFVVAIAHAVSAGTGPRETYDYSNDWLRSRAEAGDADRRATAAVVQARLEAAASDPPKDFSHQQGWVLTALHNAFWQLLHAPELAAGVRDTVRRGGDTDTNAAISGALLGAVHGVEALPDQWSHAILNCRPAAGDPEVHRSRPKPFWPVDSLLVAERLAGLWGLLADG
jgi:ADP-ribosyl-[dinitrogen reductase] hydrolase